MSDLTMTFLMLAMFIAAISAGLPVAWALGSVSIITALLFIGPKFVFPLVTAVFSGMSNWILVAVPLFILMAMILDKADILVDLFDTAYKWSGKLRGGLAVGVVIVGTVFAACSGITAGAVVTMGITVLPLMMERKYNKDIALGSILAGGTLGQLIPPSTVILLYGSFTSVSVGGMFAGGIVAGLILSALFVIYILIRAWMQKDLCPPLLPEERASWKEKFASLPVVILPIILIVSVLGSIFSGAATPTEAAAIGVVGATLCAAIRRKLTWSVIKSSTTATLKSFGMIGWIVVTSLYFGVVLTGIGGVAIIENAINMTPGGATGALIAMLVTLFAMGMIMETGAIVIIISPIFAPIAAHLGYDPVWFGVIFAVMMQTGYISPPFGWSLFYLKGVAPKEVSMTDVYHSAWPFLALQLIGLAIFVAFPSIVLWLPHLLFPT